MKTPIRRLDSLTHNDTAATKLINDNFEALQQGIEDALSRSGKTPNFMDAPLDMNMNRIINIADPVDDYDLANKHYVDEQVAAEALARQSADNTLQQYIDDEATARQNADSTLQGNIDAEETRAKAAEKAITDTLDTYGDIIIHDADEFATAAQGAKADTALQPNDNISELNNDVGYITEEDLPTVGNGTITITQGGVVKGIFTTNQAGNTTIEVDEGGGIQDTGIIYLERVLIESAASSEQGNLDVTSYVDTTKNYFPIVQIDGHVTTDARKLYYWWSSYRTIDDNRYVTLYKADSSETFSAYFNIILIPVEASGTVIEGLSDGVAGISESYSAFIGADGTNAGTVGLVPAPAATDNVKYLKGDGTFSQVAYSEISGTPSLATVATTGAYSDLIGTPDLSGYQVTSNLVTSVSSASTDSQYPSAKLFYDTCGDIETLINAL